MGDLDSEISVTAESAPGEAEGFLEKKEENLPPGDCGFFESIDLTEVTESMRRGGGLSPGRNPMPLLSNFCKVTSSDWG